MTDIDTIAMPITTRMAIIAACYVLIMLVVCIEGNLVHHQPIRTDSPESQGNRPNFQHLVLASSDSREVLQSFVSTNFMISEAFKTLSMWTDGRMPIS